MILYNLLKRMIICGKVKQQNNNILKVKNKKKEDSLIPKGRQKNMII